MEFSGYVTPLPGSEASRALRASILPLSFLGMVLLLAPISVADFSGMESKMLTTAVLAGEMVLLGGARKRRSPAM